MLCDITVQRPYTDNDIQLLRYPKRGKLGGLRSTGTGWVCVQPAVTNGKCKYHVNWKIQTTGKDMVNDIVSAAMDRGIK